MGTEMGKAEKSRDYRLAEVHKLSAEIGELDSKQDSLELEIKELKESLADLKSTAEEANEMREMEKKENVAQIKKAREGLTAVTEAIGILKTFYKSAAKASLLQASPVDEENPGAASGSYKGNQGNLERHRVESGLLEVIKSDFEHTVETVSAEEKQAAADFVEFDRKNKVSTQGRSTKLELDTEDLATTKSTLEETHKDLKSNMDLLDSALEELEELKPTCVDSGMSYAERIEKREQEMAALKRVMCMLDADKIEPECQTR